MSTYSTTKGFTLLEIIVSLAIVSIALTAIVKGVIENTQHTEYLRNKTIAQWVASNEITQYQIAKAFPASGTYKGQSRMVNQDWLWSMKVINTPDKNIKRLEISVNLASEEPNNDLIVSDDSLINMVGFLEKP